MNLYQYIHSTLYATISENYPAVDLSRIRVSFQVSPVNRIYICTAVPRVIMSSSGNNRDSNTIAHKLVSCIKADQTFINPDIFISDGFINFKVSISYTNKILFTPPTYDLHCIGNSISDKNLPVKLSRLLDHADSLYPEINSFPDAQHPLLNHTETAIITLIAFSEFTHKESTQSFLISSLTSLLKKYYLEVPVFTKDVAVSVMRIRLIKQACSALYHQIKSAQPT